MNHIPSGEDAVSIVVRKASSFLESELDNSTQFSLLDIGCGEGWDINFISSTFKNIRIRGIDISSNAIKKATKLNSNKNNITFECMDWKSLDETQYDIIYISGVYHFFKIDDRIAFISKIKRILKQNGLFFLSTLSSNDTQYYGKGLLVKNDPNSFQSEYFLHFSSKEELLEDFNFLRILDVSEFYHKNYAKDIAYHTMWFLAGKKK